jgi:hypothetical protein
VSRSDRTAMKLLSGAPELRTDSVRGLGGGGGRDSKSVMLST